MTGRVPPHDPIAEKALLGAMVYSGEALAAGIDCCTVSDFYLPVHQHIFDAMDAMYRHGELVDPVTLADELGRRGHLEQAGGLVGLTLLADDCPAISNARSYAAILAKHTTGRRLIQVLTDYGRSAWAGKEDPYELVEGLQAELTGMGTAVSRVPDDGRTWDAFWDRPGDVRKPWVIEGMLRLGWRCIIVAAEGKGKTFVTSQVALCAGQGIHPFSFTPIPPIRTLFVDLENPEEHLDLRGKMMRPSLRRAANGSYQAERTWVWHREGGINLRSRPGRAAFEAMLQHVRPQLVVIAPVYKMFRTLKTETDEQAAGEVQQVLDDLRTRYGFALILEHHAPKGVTRAREMVPFGSSLWLRWPELGKALIPDDDHPGSLKVDVFRPDRMPCGWPKRLDRAKTWPWVGWYEHGGDPVYQQEERF